jgi:hypothetical protein
MSFTTIMSWTRRGARSPASANLLNVVILVLLFIATSSQTRTTIVALPPMIADDRLLTTGGGRGGFGAARQSRLGPPPHSIYALITDGRGPRRRQAGVNHLSGDRQGGRNAEWDCTFALQMRICAAERRKVANMLSGQSINPITTNFSQPVNAFPVNQAVASQFAALLSIAATTDANATLDEPATILDTVIDPATQSYVYQMVDVRTGVVISQTPAQAQSVYGQTLARLIANGASSAEAQALANIDIQA